MTKLISYLILSAFAACIVCANESLSGSIDKDFKTHDIRGEVRTVVVSKDGYVLCGGFFTFIDGMVAQNLVSFDKDGNFLRFFDVGTGPTNTVESLGVDSSKIIVVGKFQKIKGQDSARVAIFEQDGSLAGFQPSPGAGNDVFVVEPDKRGSYYIGGKFTNFNRKDRGKFVRVNSDGSLVADFDEKFSVSGEVFAACSMGGIVYFGGKFGGVRNEVTRTAPHKSISKISSDGHIIYEKFGKNGPVNGAVMKILPQGKDKLLVAGSFSQYSSNNKSNIKVSQIVRISAVSGALDESFCLKPMDIVGKVNDVIVHPLDGKILICGRFTKVHNKQCNRLARLNPDGTLDETFDPGSGADGEIHSMALTAEGDIIIAGNFSTYNGVACRNLAKVKY